jgi:NAD(P)-dependent dehydrogenase (short-subunit alcohol dehydrogenase family)
MELGLSGKVCVVTGSTSGIGLETVRQLKAEGATVVTSGRSPEGVGDLHVAADLAKPGEPERLIAAALERFDHVDCLVNNVGWAEIHTWDDLSDELWERSWQINVMSAVRALRATLPGMKERGAGAIVNVSSTAAKRPSLSMPESSVTKAAMLSLSRLVADLYAKDGIRCNAVTPGPTATDAWIGEGGLADQLRGLAGSIEIGAVDRRGRVLRELAAERTRLLPTGLVQRRLALALPAALAIRVRLAVTGQQERRRHAD